MAFYQHFGVDVAVVGENFCPHIFWERNTDTTVELLSSGAGGVKNVIRPSTSGNLVYSMSLFE